MKEQQTNAGKKETRQANQILHRAVQEQREEGGPGKDTEARIAPRGHSPKKGNKN